MEDESKFTWSRMSIMFPEWKYDTSKNFTSLLNDFKEKPRFLYEKIQFLLEKDYCVEVTLNQKIPNWIIDNESEIKRKYLDLSKKIQEEISSEIKNSIPILESWRNLIGHNDGGQWKGNLQDNLDFNKESDEIGLYDYYRFNLRLDRENNSPWGILEKISKLPEDSLNEKWKKYYDLKDFIGREYKIIGDTLTECIENADKIYKVADELKNLKF